MKPNAPNGLGLLGSRAASFRRMKWLDGCGLVLRSADGNLPVWARPLRHTCRCTNFSTFRTPRQTARCVVVCDCILVLLRRRADDTGVGGLRPRTADEASCKSYLRYDIEGERCWRRYSSPQ